jgi:hypothetical protein
VLIHRRVPNDIRLSGRSMSPASSVGENCIPSDRAMRWFRRVRLARIPASNFTTGGNRSFARMSHTQNSPTRTATP